MTYSAKERYRDHARQYQQEIHRILLQEWDPIGIADAPSAGRVRKLYPPNSWNAHSPRAQTKTIRSSLAVETVQMGLIGARPRTERVVDFLIALREQIEAHI